LADQGIIKPARNQAMLAVTTHIKTWLYMQRDLGNDSCQAVKKGATSATKLAV
jgi:hypothetical protein